MSTPNCRIKLRWIISYGKTKQPKKVSDTVDVYLHLYHVSSKQQTNKTDDLVDAQKTERKSQEPKVLNRDIVLLEI